MLQIPFIIMDRLDESTVSKLCMFYLFWKDPFCHFHKSKGIKGNTVLNNASNIHISTDVPII